MRPSTVSLRIGSRWLLGGQALLLIALATAWVPALRAQAAATGTWDILPYLMPINPVHMALLRDGRVLVVAGSGNVAAETNFQAAVWDPVSGSIVTQTLAWDMFCNGMVQLPDGRILINGGNLRYDPFLGEPRNAIFDPATGLFTDIQDMAHGRWYPTTTVLGDGRVMTFSGLNETNGATNTAVEIYTPTAGWSPEYQAGWTPPLYPRMHLLSDGRVAYTGSGTGTRLFTPSTQTWSPVVATTNYSGTRTYGTSVLLPLSPADGYRSRVMIFGGGDPATNTTEIIDFSASSPRWTTGPAMSQARIEMNATLLPNGKVLALGGSARNEDATTASLNADLYDPATNAFASAGSNAYPRLYHSNALLLPNATVAVAGGNPVRGSVEQHIEIYSPAYLFNGNGTPAQRPVITSVTPDTLGNGAAFQIVTPDYGNISSVALVRPGTPTHAFDMDQRLVRLSFSPGTGLLNVTAPPDGNIAPPGYYMLFIVNSAGVPSVATFVRLTTTTVNAAPTASITSPSSDVTIATGGSVSFSGTGTDPDGSIASYGWTFPGGSPGSSASASPGAVVYGTAGTYLASLTVTDNLGLASQPVTRTITVADQSFTLSATPASRTITSGSTTTYSVTVAGASGSVTLSVSGNPKFVNAKFNPSTLTGSGTSTLTLMANKKAAAGTYPLVISATSGSVVRTANVTLVVQ